VEKITVHALIAGLLASVSTCRTWLICSTQSNWRLTMIKLFTCLKQHEHINLARLWINV